VIALSDGRIVREHVNATKKRPAELSW